MIGVRWRIDDADEGRVRAGGLDPTSVLMDIPP
jgi:hypothetical protein